MKRHSERLTRAEWDIMKVIWRKKEVGVKDVTDELKDKKGWARNTVHTLMDRMAKKGVVSQKKIGGVHLYRPILSYARAMRNAAREFASRALDGAAGSAFTYLVENADMSEDELKELRELIDNEIRNRSRRK